MEFLDTNENHPMKYYRNNKDPKAIVEKLNDLFINLHQDSSSKHHISGQKKTSKTKHKNAFSQLEDRLYSNGLNTNSGGDKMERYKNLFLKKNSK